MKEKLSCGNMKGLREANLTGMVISAWTIKPITCLESRHAIVPESHADAFLWPVQFAYVQNEFRNNQLHNILADFCLFSSLIQV